MDSKLWNRIVHFRVGSVNDSFDFISRLARDNRWSADFARRVYREYLHFMYLAVRANHPVTPSDEVDQAWHLHLTYSRSYWDEFCGAVLEEVVHHDPTRGGSDERQKFRSWYAETLQSYEATFGYPPPPDIWPPSATRFSRGPNFVRINAQDFLLFPRSVTLGGGIVGITAGAVGCRMNPFELDGGTFLVSFAIVSGISIVAMLWGDRWSGSRLGRFSFIPLVVVVCFGFIRICQGIVAGHPVGDLACLEIWALFFLLGSVCKKKAVWGSRRDGASGCSNTFGENGFDLDSGFYSDGGGGDSGCGSGCGGCGAGGD